VLRAVACSHRQLLRLIMGQATAPSVHAIGAAQLVAWGAAFYAIPPLLPAISAELAVPMSSLSMAITIGLILNAFGSLLVAAWIRRRGARVPMVTGSIVASIALVLLATSATATLASAGLMLLGAAQAALLYEPAFAAVSAQTTDPIARTRSIQIIAFWGGWAALWALPTATLIGGWLGWRVTLLLLAGLLGIHTTRVHLQLPPPRIRVATTTRVRAPRISIGLAAAFALGSFATMAIVVHGLVLLDRRAVSLETASIVFALLAPVQIAGRLWFMRRNGRLARHDAPLPFLLVAAGILALLAAPALSGLAGFVVLFGVGAGLMTTMRAAIVVAGLRPEHVAQQLGSYGFVTSLARAIAPALALWIHVALGYQLALLAFAGMAAAAALLVWRAGQVGSPPGDAFCPRGGAAGAGEQLELPPGSANLATAAWHGGCSSIPHAPRPDHRGCRRLRHR
jgi:hypothetical protein